MTAAGEGTGAGSVRADDGSSASDRARSLPDRIRAGAPGAAHELVVRFQRGVAVILRRSGVRQADVQDLEQDVFRRVLEKIRDGAVDEPDRLAGYVAAIARNLAVEAARRGPDVAAPATVDATAEPGATGVLDELLARERNALVHRLLDELPVDRDREVLRRIYIAGEEREQVCQVLALAPQQLNRVLHRARERFRALYEDAVRAERRRWQP